jgi:putative addiction module CopG family antidote
MEITLPPELLKFVEQKVQAGQYDSAAAVIQGALVALKQQDELTDEDVAELREDVKVGLEQLARGEGAPWDAEQTKARLRERISAAKGAS